MLLSVVLNSLQYLHKALSDSSNGDQVEQAINKCRDKLARDPDFPPAQFLLGKLLQSIPGSDFEEAADLSWRAGTCNDRPLDDAQRVEALARAATLFSELGDDHRAVESYKQLLKRIEDQESVEGLLHECTSLLISQLDAGRGEKFSFEMDSLAAGLVQRFPKSVVVLQFCGVISRKLGHIEAAYQSYHDATALLSAKRDSLETIVQSNILASSAARQAGKPTDVQMSYLESAYQYVEGDSRIELYDSASTSRSDMLVEILVQMGTVQKASGRNTASIRYFQEALRMKPNDGHAMAQLASLDALPDSSSVDHLESDYVRDLFDGYASRFEDSMNSLRYEGHKWVVDETIKALNTVENCAASGKHTIIDVGCGTGLVGEHLVRSYHQSLNLVGVDLSERMAKLAASKRASEGNTVYASVHQTDALEFLSEQSSVSVHAVVAADVFIYIGELEPIFLASRRVLVENGAVIFSVELCTEDKGMVLLSSGRFGHSRGYVEIQAAKAGFAVKTWREGVLRQQRGERVDGAVVVLTKIKDL